MAQTKPRYLSGIQPSGQLHIGNYFGAIRQHAQKQVAGDSFYFIANYHALTTINDADTLRTHTQNVAVTYLSCGLDPTRSVLFRQSDVPEVTELTWILMTVTGMGLLERAVSYKDKIAKGITPSCGLFAYPVLMAADILAYRSNIVPVGPDQVQHVEMTREIAKAFNHLYGDVFVIPAHEKGVEVAVPGTDGAKMSKNYNNTIPIFASGTELEKIVKGIKTSSAGIADSKDPETCNVFKLYELVASKADRDAMAERYRAGGYGFGDAKKELIAGIESYFSDARAQRDEYLRNAAQVEDILQDGARRAREIAREVTDQVRAACGLATR